MVQVPNAVLLQINLLAIFVLLTLVFSLVFKKDNVKANVLLGILLSYTVSTISLNVISIFLHEPRLLFLNAINAAINFTFGPVLLSYLAFIQGKSTRWLIKGFWHYVPAVLAFSTSFYYLAATDAESVVLMKQMHAGEEPVVNTLAALLLLHLWFYLFRGWKSVTDYREKAEELGVREIQASVRWQVDFIKYLFLMMLLLLLAYLLPVFIWGKAHVYSDLIAVPVISLFTYIFIINKGLSYHVIYNKQQYQEFFDTVTPLNKFIDEVEALKGTGNDKRYTENLILKEKLEKLLEEEKIYTRSGLKLNEVADLLNISPAALSAFIKTSLKTNFSDLINRYRIEEAKQNLIHIDYLNYKIEYIGEMSGFNSKASFFRVFKKNIGKTPLEYRDKHVVR